MCEFATTNKRQGLRCRLPATVTDPRRSDPLLLLPTLGNVKDGNDAHQVPLRSNRVYNYIGQSEHQKFVGSLYPAAVTNVRPRAETVNGIPNARDSFRCCPLVPVFNVLVNVLDIEPCPPPIPNLSTPE